MSAGLTHLGAIERFTVLFRSCTGPRPSKFPPSFRICQWSTRAKSKNSTSKASEMETIEMSYSWSSQIDKAGLAKSLASPLLLFYDSAEQQFSCFIFKG